MNWIKRFFPVLVAVLAVLLVAMDYGRNAKTAGAKPGYDYDLLSQTAVMDDGRAKPLDSVARNAMLALYGKQQFVHNGEKVDAIVWMMDLIATPAKAHDYQVIRVDHADVIELAGLRPSDGYDNKFFSYSQLLPARAEIMSSARTLRDKKTKTVYDNAIETLAEKFFLYESFASARRPLVIPPEADVEDSAWRPYDQVLRMLDPNSMEAELVAFYAVIQITREQGLSAEQVPDFFSERVREGALEQRFFRAAVLYSAHMAGPEVWDGAVAQITASSQQPEMDRALYDQLSRYIASMESDPSLWNLLDMTGVEFREGYDAHWRAVVRAYRDQEPQTFNAALAERSEALSGQEVEATESAGFEVLFNRARPFVQAQALYVLGFLLAMVTLYFGRSAAGTWGRSVWLGVMVALGFAFGVHTLGILSRMYIHGRPPVTDLYSSAVLVGWASAGVCLLIEWISKRGIGGVVATVCGFTTLIIAHHLHLESGGDTMGPMRAVLDSNFWLATHVIVVTLGYAATFVAGMLAIVYIVMGMATPKLDRTAARQLTQMVYGTVCFALLLSFVGTVLGGIWADQSWGRFWGWDPKENGAVMIVIMNAIILHAKWGRLVRERGLMVLAIGGNIITAWSWFGTNELGVGLHSYGFTEGTVFWLTAFAASQMLIMAVALIVPTPYWWSFRKKPAKPKAEGNSPSKREKNASGPRPSVSGA